MVCRAFDKEENDSLFNLTCSWTDLCGNEVMLLHRGWPLSLSGLVKDGIVEGAWLHKKTNSDITLSCYLCELINALMLLHLVNKSCSILYKPPPPPPPTNSSQREKPWTNFLSVICRITDFQWSPNLSKLLKWCTATNSTSPQNICLTIG